MTIPTDIEALVADASRINRDYDLAPGTHGYIRRSSAALTALQADLAAAVARAEEAEARLAEVEADRPFIIGANHGWDEATEQMAAHFDCLAVLRKMWSAREVSEIIRGLDPIIAAAEYGRM